MHAQPQSKRSLEGRTPLTQITIRQIGEHFNVSAATVSKAINGLPGVSERLRDEIIKYSGEKGYVPNSFGRGLRGKKLKVIGVVVTDITNPLYAINVRGLEAEAQRHGYNIFLCNSREDWRSEREQINALLQKSVDGLIITPASCDDEEYAKHRFDLLRARGIPVVMMYRVITDDGHDYDYVKSDNVHGSYTAMRYLMDKGHQRIVFLTHRSHASSHLERNAGVLKAYSERGIEELGDYIRFCDDMSFDGAYRATQELLASSVEFSAIFAINDNMAFGSINALLASGRKVPDDVAVVGYDDNIYAQMNVIPLTTVHQESEEFGKRAAALLIDRIEGRRTAYVHEVSQPRLVVRESA